MRPLSFTAALLAASLLSGACSKGSGPDDPNPGNEPGDPVKPSVITPKEITDYRGPDDPDHYVELSDWSKRSKWNLANVHDPTVRKAADGYFYMYQTDASYGNAHTAGGHFHGRRSKDLVKWEYLGGTMQKLPEWVIPKLNEIRAEMGLDAVYPKEDEFGYWAPSFVKVRDDLYRMYYSIVVPGVIDGDGTWSERAFIGMMETSNPALNSSWTDKGYVITNPSDKGLNFHVPAGDWANCYFKFNAIDPSAIVTPQGEHWLIYGSWHSGIAAVQLNPETGKIAGEPDKLWGSSDDIAKCGKLIATRQMLNRWQGSEGPDVVYRDGYYYLFLAYDALDVPYNTRVARSRNIDGPYVDCKGTDITNVGGEAFPVVTHPYQFEGHPGWVGISHCTVFDDGNGNWFYSSQARLPHNAYGNPYANAIMLGHVRSIVWTEDGWPLVLPERYGNVPQLPIKEEELAGEWEVIQLVHSYAQMDKSVRITLADNHQVKGSLWSGSTWSFDPAANILKIGTIKLHLRRECDWEDSQRRATIVFAGLGNKTYWGKKKL